VKRDLRWEWRIMAICGRGYCPGVTGSAWGHRLPTRVLAAACGSSQETSVDPQRRPRRHHPPFALVLRTRSETRCVPALACAIPQRTNRKRQRGGRRNPRGRSAACVDLDQRLASGCGTRRAQSPSSDKRSFARLVTPRLRLSRGRRYECEDRLQRMCQPGPLMVAKHSDRVRTPRRRQKNQ
jgi:hypothetical protein